MSTHNEQVTPAPFEAATPAAPQPPSGPAREGAPKWVVPALLGLLVLAAGVVFLLPGMVGPQQAQPTTQVEEGASEPAGGAANQPAAELPPESSPWSDAQMAKLRKEAQDVLAELLDLQSQLEERSVQAWAPEAFAAAAEAATRGDELYRQREFSPATEAYLEARNGLQALLDKVPEVVAEQLAAATTAIEAGDAEAATAALDLAALVEPENADLASLRARAANLEQLVPLLEQAAEAEASGDLAGAEQLLRQAVELDGEHQRAAGELERVAAAHIDQQFNDAMSDGYADLDENRFRPARDAFRRAAKLHPGSAEAASALQEVEDAETAYRLANLRRSGRGHESKEEWAEAVRAYEQAIEIDDNVLFARDGLDRTRQRARLDKQFRAAIDEPERLADVAVAEVTAVLLQKAATISPRGPVLEKQIRTLEELIEKANTPISVTLRSDLETEVIVYKVARLGRFDQQTLTLRPGTYTAVGTRIGYRDVRETFTVSHDSAPPAVVVTCTEQI